MTNSANFGTITQTSIQEIISALEASDFIEVKSQFIVDDVQCEEIEGMDYGYFWEAYQDEERRINFALVKQRLIILAESLLEENMNRNYLIETIRKGEQNIILITLGTLDEDDKLIEIKGSDYPIQRYTA